MLIWNWKHNFIGQSSIKKPIENESEQKLPSRSSIIREFALNTSTHGIPGIARSQSKHNCIFWSISFLSFNSIMLMFIIQSIMIYFQHPTQTSVTMATERSHAFPAVTICNYSPARIDLIITALQNFTVQNNLTKDSIGYSSIIADAKYIRDFLIYKITAHESIEQFFFQLKDMLISCQYNDEDCFVSDFISFISPSYGPCYTFNARQKNTTKHRLRYTNDNGGYGKLKLILYAHSHLYVPFATDGNSDIVSCA